MIVDERRRRIERPQLTREAESANAPILTPRLTEFERSRLEEIGHLLAAKLRTVSLTAPIPQQKH
jgi:hypothetical protein